MLYLFNAPLICDMIKGNESDVTNVDFHTNKVTDSYLYILFGNFKSSFISLQPVVQWIWGFDQNSISNGQHWILPAGQPETPSFPGPDWSETGPGSGNSFKNIFGSGRGILFRDGPGRDIFFTGVWDIFSRDFGVNLPFIPKLLSLISTLFDVITSLQGIFTCTYCSLKLDVKLKSLISTQNIFHWPTSEFSGWSGSKLVNFGLMLNCFGPVRSGENIIGSSGVGAIKFTIFRSGLGQKITGQYGVEVPKTLPRRTLLPTCHSFPLIMLQLN